VRSLHILGAVSAMSLLVAGSAAAEPDDNAEPTTVSAASAGAETTLTVSNEVEYRAALIALSAVNTGFHTIVLDADITIDDGNDPTYTGTRSLTIEGGGFVMDATGSSRILNHDTGAGLRIMDVTMVGGSTPDDGGAVHAEADVEIDDSTFDANAAGGDGGAIEAAGLLSIAHSTFSGNTAAGDGGGVDTSDDGSLIVESSTFIGNTAALDGGAMEGEEGVVMVNSTIVDNEGGNGIINAGALGLGIHSSTIAGNTSSSGGAVRSDESANLLVNLSVLDGNSTNCSGFDAITSTFSYSTDASCGFTGTGNVEGGPPPGLAAPADNGGPTSTMLPDIAGPLVDVVPVSVCRPLIDLDQRDEPRPADGLPGGSAGCDIGAVEVQAEVRPPPPPPPDEEPDDTVVSGTPAFTG
jgi:predicted outer membrane repeat protein